MTERIAWWITVGLACVLAGIFGYAVWHDVTWLARP